VDRGDDGALGEAEPGVGIGDAVQLRLKPPRELLHELLPPGLAGLLGSVFCSSRMRRSLRLLRRITRLGARGVGIGDEPPSLRLVALATTGVVAAVAEQVSLQLADVPKLFNWIRYNRNGFESSEK